MHRRLCTGGRLRAERERTGHQHSLSSRLQSGPPPVGPAPSFYVLTCLAQTLVFPQRIWAAHGQCSGYCCHVANYSRTSWLKTTTILLRFRDQWVRNSDRGHWEGLVSALWCPDLNWEDWKAGVAWKLGARIIFMFLHSHLSCWAQMARWLGLSVRAPAHGLPVRLGFLSALWSHGGGPSEDQMWVPSRRVEAAFA